VDSLSRSPMIVLWHYLVDGMIWRFREDAELRA
jgi:hypothetical protein